MVRDYTLRDLPYNALINAQNLARDFKTATGYAVQSGREYLGGIEQEAKRIGSEQAIRNAFLKQLKTQKYARYGYWIRKFNPLGQEDGGNGRSSMKPCTYNLQIRLLEEKLFMIYNKV